MLGSLRPAVYGSRSFKKFGAFFANIATKAESYAHCSQNPGHIVLASPIRVESGDLRPITNQSAFVRTLVGQPNCPVERIAMDLRKLKTLIDLVSDSNITELEITEAEGKVRIVKGAPAGTVYAQAPMVMSAVPAMAAAPAAAAAAEVPAVSMAGTADITIGA